MKDLDMTDEHDDIGHDESELIRDVQRDVGEVERLLRRCSSKMRKVARINRDAERLDAADASMRLQGALDMALGRVLVGHADASVALRKNWPDFGAEITTRSGHR